MLQRGFRFKTRLHPASPRRFENFLRVAIREFAREMRLQIGKHEVDMPTITLLKSHVDLVHGDYLFTLFWKVATFTGSQSSWGE